MRPDSAKLKKQLDELQSDYLKHRHYPFKRFYCPLTGEDDETAELCLGHVINQSIPNSSKKTIVQRKDIDGFYGRLFETAFVTIMQIQNRRNGQVLYDAELRKRVGLQIFVDDEFCDHYEYQGGTIPPQYSAKTVSHSEFGSFTVILKKKIDTRVKLLTAAQ